MLRRRSSGLSPLFALAAASEGAASSGASVMLHRRSSSLSPLVAASEGVTSGGAGVPCYTGA